MCKNKVLGVASGVWTVVGLVSDTAYKIKSPI